MKCPHCGFEIGPVSNTATVPLQHFCSIPSPAAAVCAQPMTLKVTPFIVPQPPNVPLAFTQAGGMPAACAPQFTGTIIKC